MMGPVSVRTISYKTLHVVEVEVRHVVVRGIINNDKKPTKAAAVVEVAMLFGGVGAIIINVSLEVV